MCPNDESLYEIYLNISNIFGKQYSFNRSDPIWKGTTKYLQIRPFNHLSPVTENQKTLNSHDRLHVFSDPGMNITNLICTTVLLLSGTVFFRLILPSDHVLHAQV